MWQLYSKPDSIAIKIPVPAFIEKVQNKEFNLTGSLNRKLKYGLVQYCRLDDLESLTKIDTPEEPGFLKDKSYSHEAEFRIILETEKKIIKNAKVKPFVSYEQIEKVNKLIDQKILYILFNDFNKLPFELIFHPQSSEWHRINIIETISKFDLNFPLKESSLTKIFN